MMPLIFGITYPTRNKTYTTDQAMLELLRHYYMQAKYQRAFLEGLQSGRIVEVSEVTQ